MLEPKKNTNKHLKFAVKLGEISQEDLDIIAAQIEKALWEIYNNLLFRRVDRNAFGLEINAEIYIKPIYEQFILGSKNGTITSGQ
ncbi:hypothetical protein [Mannheimia haemolytica]|uniref:hypothetical protein n=1 Tax=Mannheimia haemolytica TaxID=75985 RepID=UPI002EC7AADC|nr:hypothetical protein [Mannheimia haemolytica]